MDKQEKRMAHFQHAVVWLQQVAVKMGWCFLTRPGGKEQFLLNMGRNIIKTDVNKKNREMGRIMTRRASGTAKKQRRKAMSLWLLHVFGSLLQG